MLLKSSIRVWKPSVILKQPTRGGSLSAQLGAQQLSANLKVLRETNMSDAPPLPPILLANKKFLAGSELPGFPKYLTSFGPQDIDEFILTDPNASLINVVDDIKQVIEDRIIKSGAILIRKLSSVVSSSPIFSQLVSSLGPQMPYIAGFATRDELEDAPGIMNASDDPDEVTLEPHLEMSYRSVMPSKICFYCHRPPTEGGQTPLVDMRSVAKDAMDHRHILADLIDNGVRYYRTLASIKTPAGSLYSWEKTFASNDKDKVEKDLASFGYKIEWTKKNSLRYSYVMTTMNTHPVTGEQVWCNQLSTSNASYFDYMPDRFANLYESYEDTPFHTTHVDGTPVTAEELFTIRKLLWKNAKAHWWQPGDLIVLDNRAVGHGRMGFPRGDKRQLVVGILH